MRNDERLASAWKMALLCLGVRYHDQPPLDAVIARYDEPHRHYHGVDHPRHVLDAANTLSWTTIPAPAVIAIMYHDCVYKMDAQPFVNEEDSATVMKEDLSGVLPQYVVEEIERIIYATFPGDFGKSPDTLTEALVRDADLSGFSGSYEVCAANTKKIRKEMEHVSDEAFAEGRKNFLQYMLDLPQIMWYPHAQPVREEHARENITRELESLIVPAS